MNAQLRQCGLAVAAVLLLGAAPAAAQTGEITGTIVDAESASPVSGARVEAHGGGGVAASTFSGSDGAYRLSGLAPGAYALVVAREGFETVRIEGIRVATGDASIRAVSLVPLAFRLNPVVVSASKRREKALEAPATVAVVDSRAIEDRPATTPADHIRATPGVDVITQGIQSTNVVLRGFNNIFSGSLHMLTDNRIAGVPSLRVNLLHFIPANSQDIDRIEVVLGPGSALYGPNTANGVLHVITKSPLDHQGTTASIAGGERSVLQADFRTAHLLSEDFGVKVSGQYLQGREWEYVDPVEALVGATRDNDIRKWGIDARADWRITPEMTAVLAFGTTTAENGIEMTGLSAAQVRGWTSSYYQARFNYDRLFAQVYLNTSDAGETFLLRTQNPIVDESRLAVAQLQHGVSVGDRQSFTYGLDYIRTMPETGGTIHGAYEDDDVISELGAYLQSETALHEKLDLVLAGRYDTHSELEDPVVSPRAALVFKPRDDHNVRLTYNRAFSTPTAINLFLDLDGGPAPGVLGLAGYRVRAQGTRKSGFTFGGSDGFRMRSPFVQSPGQLLPADAPMLWRIAVDVLFAQGQIDQTQREQLLAITPTGGEVGVNTMDLTNPSGALAPLSDAAVPEVPGVRESTVQTLEAGYKGLFGERLLLAADLWYSRHRNFTSPLLPQTPLLFLDGTSTAAYLVSRGMSAEQAAALAAGMARIPGGVISSDAVHATGADILVTYRNFGEVDLWGADLSATALLDDRWSLGVAGSYVSDDHFRTEGQLVALNAPRLKGMLSLGYRDEDAGVNAELRARHTASFPVNSAAFVGTGCIDGGSGSCVEAYTLLDAMLGYRLPALRGATVQLGVQNLLDQEYRSFVGVPAVRRFAMLRLRYAF